ncbi:adenosine kinase [Rhodoferax sp. U2-2l]|uniref:adenosine kinase n=1 Tax=Rhodoferax sp. U2-2l TaxID=2884000 RepID=UPI001D0B827C|nr:adenosine kinase [Rhodoferax sp. U2-2l]MCB8748677.1 adenosine kinase [Rhodoferax sp. U2-2l]
MSHYDVYAIGNALVDSQYEVSDAQLNAAGVEKRHMTLIDAARRTELLSHVYGVPAHRTGGGSAGNTVVAVAQLGGKAFYSCRVADDELGDFYTQDLLSHGVATNLAHTRAPEGQTGVCLVMVTPDAERSMSTFLGATADIDATSLHPHDIAKSKVYYMEGYLAASPTGLDAALKGRQMAVDAGVALATTLSDMTMINFCRPGLDAMVGSPETGTLDYLFCNEEEAQVWCGSTDLAQICRQLSQQARVVCLTRSAKGCLVLEGDKVIEVPAVKVKAVDTNGAGDMFAGAFLYAVTHGHSHAQAALLANQCAAKVVSQVGNRLSQQDVNALKSAFEKHALLHA